MGAFRAQCASRQRANTVARAWRRPPCGEPTKTPLLVNKTLKGNLDLSRNAEPGLSPDWPVTVKHCPNPRPCWNSLPRWTNCSRKVIPPVFKTNFATALLAENNLPGCLGVLQELRDGRHPAVQKLWAAIARWKGGLTLWQKVNWYLGGQPDRPVALDFSLGDLE